MVFADFAPRGTHEVKHCRSTLSVISTYLCIDLYCGASTRRIALQRINDTCQTLFNVSLPHDSLQLAKRYSREDISRMARIHRGDTLGPQEPRRAPVLPALEFFHGWLQTLVRGHENPYSLSLSLSFFCSS